MMRYNNVKLLIPCHVTKDAIAGLAAMESLQQGHSSTGRYTGGSFPHTAIFKPLPTLNLLSQAAKSRKRFGLTAHSPPLLPMTTPTFNIEEK